MVNKSSPLNSRYAQRVLRGYTLVELITVMVIAGIMAAVAAPIFFNNDAFVVRGFHDQVLSTLRYAQQEAVAQHRNVCVTISSSYYIKLNIASGNSSSSACDTSLVSPSLSDSILGYAQTNCTSYSATYEICAPLSNTVSPPITISPATTLGFDAYGKTFSSPGTYTTAQTAITISDSNCTSDPGCASNIIYVEAETGYVH